VGQLYVEAWESGCKGVTVYREGSRAGVLLNNTEKKDEEAAKFPKKRPEVLEADVVRFQNNKEKWIAFVGLLDGRPYEIFTGLADDEDGILLPKSVQKGFIIKSRDSDGSSRYDFQYVNKRGYKTTIEGLSFKFQKEFWNYAKLISGVLRHGLAIEGVLDLVAGLQLDNENINNWKNGVERALKKYIPNGTKVKKGHCENCDSDELVYQEGCLICQSCGSSKCG
jgi:ribonucleoside-diphosphate reductase alpha chain